MLFADYQPSVPTQHRPSDSHTIQRHLQEELLFKTILSLSSSCPSEPMPLQPEPEQTWSLTRRAFFGRPRCPALPECQAHQHDCQAYQECYSVRPTSSALLLVLLCQAQPAVVLLVIHSQAPPNHPTAGSTLSALSPRDTELAGRPDDGWS